MNFSQNIKNRIDLIRPNFPTTQALLIPLLHEIQFEKGWISLEDQRTAAEYLNLPLSKVKEVVSFYTMFNKEPVGKVHLQLCTNISCWLNGSEKLLHCLEKRLGIGCGETTKNQNYTLMKDINHILYPKTKNNTPMRTKSKSPLDKNKKYSKNNKHLSKQKKSA